MLVLLVCFAGMEQKVSALSCLDFISSSVFKLWMRKSKCLSAVAWNFQPVLVSYCYCWTCYVDWKPKQHMRWKVTFLALYFDQPAMIRVRWQERVIVPVTCFTIDIYFNWYHDFLKENTKSLSSFKHLSNSWDEWVGEERLMKHTEENILKQQALDKKQGADKNVKSGRSTQAKAKNSTGKKRQSFPYGLLFYDVEAYMKKYLFLEQLARLYSEFSSFFFFRVFLIIYLCLGFCRCKSG